MIWLLILLPLAALLVGVASGFVIAWRRLPRMIARMTPSQLDAVADKVWEARGGTD